MKRDKSNENESSKIGKSRLVKLLDMSDQTWCESIKYSQQKNFKSSI